MKLYFDNTFIEDFDYDENYGIVYSLEICTMGYVFIPFLEKNLLDVSIIGKKCFISIPNNIPFIKIKHVANFYFDANIPYDPSFNFLTYYHMFSLLYTLYIEYDQYAKPYFKYMIDINPTIIKDDTIFTGTLIELEKTKNSYEVKIINQIG